MSEDSFTEALLLVLLLSE